MTEDARVRAGVEAVIAAPTSAQAAIVFYALPKDVQATVRRIVHARIGIKSEADDRRSAREMGGEL